MVRSAAATGPQRPASAGRRRPGGHAARGARARRRRALWRSHGRAHSTRPRDDRRLLEAEPCRWRQGLGPRDRVSPRLPRRTRGWRSSSAPPACRTSRCSPTRPATRCGGRHRGKCASWRRRRTAPAAATWSSRAPCRRADRRSRAAHYRAAGARRCGDRRGPAERRRQRQGGGPASEAGGGRVFGTGPHDRAGARADQAGRGRHPQRDRADRQHARARLRQLRRAVLQHRHGGRRLPRRPDAARRRHRAASNRCACSSASRRRCAPASPARTPSG